MDYSYLQAQRALSSVDQERHHERHIIDNYASALTPSTATSGGSRSTALDRERRRELPTLLTTTSAVQLANSHSGSLVPTPASTTSLSSPFTQNPGAHFLPSPSTSGQSPLPMSSRMSSGYSAPYNPQEWGQVGRSSPRMGTSTTSSQWGQPQQVPARLRHSIEDPVASPPPPYSPQRDSTAEGERPQPSRTSTSASMASRGTSSSAMSTSLYSSPTSIPNSASVERSAASVRLSMAPSNSPQPSFTTAFPPPPPPPGSRSSSKTGQDKAHGRFSLSTLTGRHRQSSQSNVAQGPFQFSEAASGQDSLSSVRPPTSRRAVSTGGLVTPPVAFPTSNTDSASSNQQKSWNAPSPLPPPPPGPPPAASRSQSASGVSDTGSSSSLTESGPRFRTRHASYLGPTLGAVPPTPAGWVDEEYARNAAAVEQERRTPTLHVNTSTAAPRINPVTLHDEAPASSYTPMTSPPLASPPTNNRSSTHGLLRSSAVRDPSAKGIRERRSESRNGKQRGSVDLTVMIGAKNSPWQELDDALRPANLDLANANPAAGPSDAINSSTPKTGGPQYLPENAANTAKRITSGKAALRTPRLDTTHLNPSVADTPPFSPAGEPSSASANRSRSPMVPPKTLPTPPPQQYSRPPSSSSLYAPSSSSEKYTSYAPFNSPDDVAMPPPLTPRRRQAAKADPEKPRDDETFFDEAIKRYQRFLERERNADTDVDRLQMFTDFMLSESSLRRRRYSEAWDQKAIDLEEVQQNIFAKGRSASRRGSGLRIATNASPGEPSARPDTQWFHANNYQPMLSPIAASLSNNGQDEMSSRGRQSSRWWESQSGYSEGGGRLPEKRSKKEMKYMGVPREEREAMQYTPEYYVDQAIPSHEGLLYGPNEYPPEKVGLHEQSLSAGFSDPCSLQDTPRHVESAPTPRQPLTPASKKLDISRFVTLPPPYPRHHPAVNNHHPDLTIYRTHVRKISDLDEVKTRKQQYEDFTASQRVSANEAAAIKRSEFRSNLSKQISEGRVSFAEAAEAETAFNFILLKDEKKQYQSEFDSFQDDVLGPLQELLNERISSTSTLLDQLQATLSTESQDPSQTLAEGDEQPELLEKLTMLKWLFEARETLHREIFNLECERSRKYRDLVSLPYKQSKNAAKLKDTLAFFVQDEQSQKIKFEESTAQRWKSFLQVIDGHVSSGVEVQLSAFWDITPNLVSILNRIPETDLTEYPESPSLPNLKAAGRWHGIQIPTSELTENPLYTIHPMQYLYALLEHAEKSTYQFIESQINLLCLLHEVRCGCLGAEANLSLALASLSSPAPPEDDNDGDEERTAEDEASKAEEKRLTAELQSAVTTAESLWSEALGSKLSSVKEGVRVWLEGTGGWEGESEVEESGVGSY